MAKGGISEKWLDELVARNDIVETIQRYIPLTQKGKNYWGLCPFHHEKTASFAVNAQEQFYHCFGCGVGGDIIRFVMEIENIGFIEACKLLAEKAGMKLPEMVYDEKESANRARKDSMRLMMKEAARFYHASLKTEAGQVALNYVRKRGFSDSIVVRFGMGYSPGFTDLINYLQSKGYTTDLMLEAGLIEKGNNHPYDALYDRLIIPIFDHYGEVIAFGGRILDTNKTKFAKYKNTTKTPLFDKSNTLYGLNFLKKVKNTVGLDSVIMVEGYMDTIALVQAGIENVVASMGTSLTLSQARLLKRYTDKVYISYDGDGAGQTATLRGLDILKSQGLDVKVIAMPEGMDPDEVIKASGKEGYIELMKQAKPLTEYKLWRLDGLLQKDNPESRIKYANAALDVLRQIDNIIERETYLPIIRDKSEIGIDYLRRQLDKPGSKASQPKTEVKQKSILDTQIDSSYYMSARYVIYANLYSHKYIDDSESLLPYLEDDSHRDIMRYVESVRQNREKVVIGNVFNALEDTTELNVILGLDFNEDADKEKYYNESVSKLKKRYIDKKVRDLSQEIATENDLVKKKELLSQLNSLVRKR